MTKLSNVRRLALLSMLAPAALACSAFASGAVANPKKAAPAASDASSSSRVPPKTKLRAHAPTKASAPRMTKRGPSDDQMSEALRRSDAAAGSFTATPPRPADPNRVLEDMDEYLVGPKPPKTEDAVNAAAGRTAIGGSRGPGPRPPPAVP